MEPITSDMYGGKGGNAWKMEDLSERFLKIKIRSGEVIDSISFQYQTADGTTKWSPLYGRATGNLHEIDINQGEYLTSIKGHWGKFTPPSPVIRSLTFVTNTRILGPYGRETGNAFELSLTPNSRIVGFYGRSGIYLDAIGVVYMQQMVTPTPPLMVHASIGPCGQAEGTFWATDTYIKLAKIKIHHSWKIDNLEFQYEGKECDLSVVETPYGESWFMEEIVLEPEEVLIGIKGHQAIKDTFTVVRSLTLISNVRTYGPYGIEAGEGFFLPAAANDKLVGFFGYGDTEFINSIGVVKTSTALIKKPDPFHPINKEEQRVIMVGPCGSGHLGSPFYFPRHTILKKIGVYHGKRIEALTLEYQDANSGIKTWSNWSNTGGKLDEVILESNEVLLSIEGHYATTKDKNGMAYSTKITSLTLHSNVRKYGPYGEVRGIPFSLSAMAGGMIIAPFGRYGRGLLYSIGIQVLNNCL